MTVVRDTTAGAADVWNVLSDGWSYATWVVGASRIRAVDPHFPAPGSEIHHSVGLWPAVLNDVTRVLAMTEGRELVLEARGMPAGKATIVLRVTPTSTGSRIEMIEHARTLPFSLVPESVQHAMVYPRNREATRRLALLAERAAVPQ